MNAVEEALVDLPRFGTGWVLRGLLVVGFFCVSSFELGALGTAQPCTVTKSNFVTGEVQARCPSGVVVETPGEAPTDVAWRLIAGGGRGRHRRDHILHNVGDEVATSPLWVLDPIRRRGTMGGLTFTRWSLLGIASGLFLARWLDPVERPEPLPDEGFRRRSSPASE